MDKVEKKKIKAPPPFIDAKGAAPTSSPVRSRAPRSVSPAKTPVRKIASPRKPKASGTTATHKKQLSNASSTLVNGISEEASVTVEVNSSVDVEGDVETTRTQVRVEMPSGLADFPLPETTEQMIAKAKEMVAEAQKIDGASSSKGTKRKAAEEELEVSAPKKARVLAEEIQKDKVKNRALIGVSVTLALG
jgi:hypothetical protein